MYMSHYANAVDRTTVNSNLMTNFRELLIEIQNCSFEKMLCNMEGTNIRHYVRVVPRYRCTHVTDGAINKHIPLHWKRLHLWVDNSFADNKDGNDILLPGTNISKHGCIPHII